jgi:hypothetical protein
MAHVKWRFRTKRFTVRLEISQTPGYQYDGEDPDGETQAKLDSGEYVAFESAVIVELDGEEIASDTLFGSVYSADSMAEFWTAHRDSNPMNRNCSIMRAEHGNFASICHYFPSMVAEAIAEAREHVRAMTVPPYIRESA